MKPDTIPHSHRPCAAPVRFLAAVIILLVTAGASLPALADDDDRSWQLGIALGAGQRTNPLVNADDININLVLDFSWYGERFFFDNGDLGFLLHESNRFAVNLVATYNNERNYYNYLTGRDLGLNILDSLGGDFRFTSIAEDAANDPSLILIDKDGEVTGRPPAFTGIADTDLATALADTKVPGRKSAVNGGLEFLYLSPLGDFQGQIVTDISSTHGGQSASLSWTHPWYFATSTGIDEISLSAGFEWKSRDLVSYYFGVRPDEAFPGRPAYDGGSGVNTYLRLSARHAFSDHWQVVSMAEREYLSGAIRHSPIVADKKTDTWYLGLYYRF